MWYRRYSDSSHHLRLAAFEIRRCRCMSGKWSAVCISPHTLQIFMHRKYAECITILFIGFGQTMEAAMEAQRWKGASSGAVCGSIGGKTSLLKLTQERQSRTRLMFERLLNFLIFYASQSFHYCDYPCWCSVFPSSPFDQRASDCTNIGVIHAVERHPSHSSFYTRQVTTFTTSNLLVLFERVRGASDWQTALIGRDVRELCATHFS